MGTLTSANAVYQLVITSLYPVPQQLQGFATDSAFDTEAAESAEVRMGVDGRMSAGYTPFVTKQTIMLQADSPSVLIFENWLEQQKIANDIFYASATIALPSTSRKYALSQGVLTSVIPIPAAKKLLEPRAFVITWQDISPAVFG